MHAEGDSYVKPRTHNRGVPHHASLGGVASSHRQDRTAGLGDEDLQKVQNTNLK